MVHVFKQFSFSRIHNVICEKVKKSIEFLSKAEVSVRGIYKKHASYKGDIR